MEITIIAATSPFRCDVKTEFNRLGGTTAGICYMPQDFETLCKEPVGKTMDRAEFVKASGHHSVFDHEYVTIFMGDVPKMFAMLLNNEKMYTTSEKSARYVSAKGEGIQFDLYQKWKDLFVELITLKYGKEKYFDEKKIEKIAQENARYFLSVYTPTSLAYTVSYRQLNYIYTWLKQIDNNSNEYLKKIKPTADKFCEYLEKVGLIDAKIAEIAKNRAFSMFAKKSRKDYFGDVYCTSYKGSLASFAQAQRHRTLSYEFKDLDSEEYYVPKIIKNSTALKAMWLEDMQKVKDITPQGKLVEIIERGTPENFVLKAKERLCTCAQLEICDQTKQTLEKYIAQTDDKDIKAMLEKINKGARCTSGYKCPSPCEFQEGITLEREV